MNNNVLIEKAAMTLADLAAGGLMNEQQFATFYRKVIDAPTILRDARTVPMSSDAMKIEAIGFGTRILRPGVEATPLDAADRSKPTTGKVQLNAKEVIAEVNISYDTLENNIEKGNLSDTIMTLIAERAALDLEELVINGDTASADSYLALLNGLMKKATSHVYDHAGGTVFDKAVAKAALKKVPAKYLRNPADWRFYVSHGSEIEYKDSIANRQTNLGDQAIQGNLATVFGVPVKGIAMLQAYDLDGAGAGTTMGSNGLLTHPKNIVVGMSRQVRIEVDRDIRGRQFIIVLTAKVDATFEEEDAVAKILKIKE